MVKAIVFAVIFAAAGLILFSLAAPFRLGLGEMPAAPVVEVDPIV